VKKIALICMTLVMALGALGVGYAMWWDDLFIDVLVQTGTVEVAWSLEDWGDSEAIDKDVSSDFAWISGDTLFVDLYDAYPCIDYWIDFNLEGVGSVPVHFRPPVITGNLPPGVEVLFYDNWVVGEMTTPIDWVNLQLHEGDMYYGRMVIHLDNATLENTAYNFFVQLIYHQYNEWDPTAIP